MKIKALTTLLVLLLFSTAAGADILVLVHGYRDDASSWYKEGIVQRLAMLGYRDGGPIRTTPRGAWGPGIIPGGGNIIYSVDLPSTAPVLVQSHLLSQTLYQLRSLGHTQPFSIIGHSAGGLVARATLVKQPELNIQRLITIATPHRGASIARLAALFSNSPMGAFAGMAGMDDFADADKLFKDLRPEKKSRLLQWLNYQPHPLAAYASVIHMGDDIVKPRSQDMSPILGPFNNGLSIPTQGGHGLNPLDGDILAALLTGPVSTP